MKHERARTSHGHNDNVMLKVLDTANPSICYYKIRPGTGSSLTQMKNKDHAL